MYKTWRFVFVSARDLGFEVNGVVFIWHPAFVWRILYSADGFGVENDAKWNYLSLFTRQTVQVSGSVIVNVHFALLH